MPSAIAPNAATVDVVPKNLEPSGGVPHGLATAGGVKISETGQARERSVTWCFHTKRGSLNAVTNARGSRKLASGRRLGLGVVATFLVRFSVGLQAVFLRPLKATVAEPMCGTGVFMFLLGCAFLWGVALIARLFDCVQLHRGGLSWRFGWLRTLPAVVAVLATPVVPFLG